jgi:hypothetical protein
MKASVSASDASDITTICTYSVTLTRGGEGASNQAGLRKLRARTKTPAHDGFGMGVAAALADILIGASKSIG